MGNELITENEAMKVRRGDIHFKEQNENIEDGERKKSSQHKFPPVGLTIWTLNTAHIIGISKWIVAIFTLTTECTSPVEWAT